jgi:hypothetical protein
MSATDNTRNAISMIEQERMEQLTKHGWTEKHDDQYDMRELALGAAAYCLQAAGVGVNAARIWPFAPENFKPRMVSLRQTDACEARIGNLVKAGALIVAEIERMRRLQQKRNAQ